MQLLSVTEQYRFETDAEAKTFIEEQKAQASVEGYTLGSYSSTYKTKKKSGEIIDEGFLVKVTKDYSGFWDGGAF